MWTELLGQSLKHSYSVPVHQAFGLAGTRWQSVYHFTVGTPVTDARIETGPPYPQRQQEDS